MSKRRKTKLEPADGFCKECGEPLSGLKERWCSTQCGSRFRIRAQRWCFKNQAPANVTCVRCGSPVAAGLWYCGDDCRVDYRRDGHPRPSRYDRPEFYAAKRGDL